MNGWKYEWAGELPPEVYDVLLELIKAEREAERDGYGTMTRATIPETDDIGFA